jgi:hypothetical protein
VFIPYCATNFVFVRQKEKFSKLFFSRRTAAPPGEEIASLHTGHTDAAGGGATGASDNSTTVYGKGDTRPVISRVAQAMLAKFGVPFRGGGIVKWERG